MTTIGDRDADVRSDTTTVDRGRLARDLIREVRGDVRFDDAARGAYANDASLYRQVPIGVVAPRDRDDVAAALAVCRRYRAPVLGRGSGTGLAGQSVNTGVVFDFTQYMHGILELDPDRGTARAQPGLINDHLRDAAAEHGLTFSVDPATHDRCTLGGMVGNNSCGTHSVYGGKTVDNVLELTVLTYDGAVLTLGPTDDARYRRTLDEGGRPAEIYSRLRSLRDRYGDLVRERYPDIPRRVSGYNLDSLLPENGFDLARALVGTESTCALVLEAVVRLLPRRPQRALLVVGYPDVCTAADHVPDFAGDDGLHALEAFDSAVEANIRHRGKHPPGLDDVPDGNAWLLVEYAGQDAGEVADRARRAAGRVGEDGHPAVFTDPGRQGEVWEVRRSAIEYARVPGRSSGLAGWEDASVAPERLGGYLRDYLDLVARHGYHATVFGHFGQGCMHNRLDLRLDTAADVAGFRAFLDEAGDIAVRHGGSLSGEHGDGQLRANQLGKMFGPELLPAFAEFKAIFDPDGMMNPGKVVTPFPPEHNLARGVDHRPRDVRTHFAFPDDHAGFADAANRCFGVGLCRHTDGGVMCPSFMVTREEEHSTRGRARLLFEMLSGYRGMDSGTGAGTRRGERRMWRDDNVKRALDLCLACKGCKSDCPVDVDMATYKAEFLSHYYARRLRPRAAYALGLIPLWARLAARAAAGQRGARRAWAGRRGEARRGRLPAAGRPGVRAPHVPLLVCHAPAAPSRRAPGAALAGHVHRPLHPAGRDRRRRGARGGRVPGADPRSGAVLRAPAVRLRHAADRAPLAAPHARRAGRADRGGDPAGRAGTELPGRVPRRADQPAARRRGRAAPPRPELQPGRGAHRHRRLPATAAAPRRADPAALPPARRDRPRRRPVVDPGDGTGPAGARLRVLRDGRQLRLRGRRAVRRLGGLRGTGDPARGARRRPRHRATRRRVQLPRADHPAVRPGAAAPGRGARARAPRRGGRVGASTARPGNPLATTATAASFPEAVRENEEVVPVNVSTWVLPSGVTVGR